MHKKFIPSFSFLLALLFSGCAFKPYVPSGDNYPSPNTAFKDEPQISRGEPNFIVDNLGHYLFSLPEKLILWEWSMGNHQISENTEHAIRTYLDDNELKEVKVRLNEYAPFGEFKRLRNNQSVGAGYRYTIGMLGWLFYTIFPGRIFGGDNYNPYTNTISLYSDSRSVGLHEAGHSKDFASRNMKGSYALVGIVPLVPLFQEYIASSDAISYIQEKNDKKLEKKAYHILYPAYGTYIGGELLNPVPGVRPLGSLIGALPGHIVGRIKGAKVKEENKPAESAVLNSY
jgi:hypothetical protein